MSYETVKVDAATIREVYTKALAELDAIWPEYEAWFTAKEDVQLKERAARIAQRMMRAEEIRKRLDDFKLELEAYDLALSAWKKKFFLFRGRAPVKPEYESPYGGFYDPELSDGFVDYRGQALKRRKKITDMLDAASLGKELYLTPDQFASLEAHRSGAFLDRIKETMLPISLEEDRS